jgi:hypothetical protein
MYNFLFIIVLYTILELPAILRFRLTKDTPDVVRRIGLSTCTSLSPLFRTIVSYSPLLIVSIN